MTQEITLYFKQGSSDKIYKASIVEKEDLYLVNFAYGRRGSTLKTGTKTQAPVALDKATKLFDKLVQVKMAKGYEKAEELSTTDYVYTSDKVQTGIHCQLLNPIDQEKLLETLKDEQWVLQEKMDGKRMLIQKKGEKITFINRKGFSVGAPETFTTWATTITEDFLIDGEAIGVCFHVFDVWNFENKSLKELPYKLRLENLNKITFNKNIQLVPSYFKLLDKQNVLSQLKEAKAEGIVLKNIEATITPGRPNSGGNQLKYKFYETASFLVHKLNDKRSVGISVLDSGKMIDVGNVTIPPNKEIPKLNSIIEIRYLYAFKGGSVYQPTFINNRDDIDKQECTIEQLKFKPE